MERIAYTVPEVAEMLFTNRQYVYTLIQAGCLISCKMGKKYIITKSNLEKFIETYGDSDLSNIDACIKAKINKEAN